MKKNEIIIVEDIQNDYIMQAAFASAFSRSIRKKDGRFKFSLYLYLEEIHLIICDTIEFNHKKKHCGGWRFRSISITDDASKEGFTK